MSAKEGEAVEAAAAPEFVLKLDDLSLRQHAGGYPEEMREPLMWLGWFLRDTCGRSLDVLVQRSKELGIEHDKTTWSRILRGRWKKDSAGNELSSPIVSVQKFLRAVQVLRDDQRVSEMAGKVPFILTPTAKEIMDFIDVRRAPERVNRFGFVVGATGTQKTATFKEYSRQHNHGLCVWMETPENGSTKEFITWLAVKYGGSHLDPHQRHKRRVVTTVNSRSTIILDNAQALYREEKGGRQPVFNFLRRLQDERECTIILSITPEFYGHLLEQMLKGYFEQFEGRAGGRRNFLVLPDYPTPEDVLAIAKGFAFKDAEKHLDYLVAIGHEPGRVRRLFEDLQQAKVQALGKTLTIAHVKEVRGED